MSLRLVIPNRTEVDSDLTVTHPWWQFSVRFNVAIPQRIPVARMHERESEGVMMRWGLVQKSTDGSLNFTSRGVAHNDTLLSSKDHRTAWLNSQRGIIPLAGFYLWQRAPQGHYQPHYVRLVNRPVFGVAALWERVETADGDVIESCALIVIDANQLIAEIDNVTGHMPGILQRKDYDSWLTSSPLKASELLQPYPQIRMVCHAVGPDVNHLNLDESSLIRPARL